MIMIQIKKDDYRLQYQSFYNLYPSWNETSCYADVCSNDVFNGNDLLIDEYYGRIFTPETYQLFTNLYGVDEKMNYYPCGITEDIFDTLRVPYRKIPIYKIKDIKHLPSYIKRIESNNSDYEILLRGQNKLWEIQQREKNEKLYLYGSENVKEPSFLPSYLRSNFDEFFIQSMWINQAAILLNDIDYDYSTLLSKSEYEMYQNQVFFLKNSPAFILYALGIAQHYGMPSIGLDLTKSLNVAIWFATFNIDIDKNGFATVNPISDFKESIIYVFRCPKNSVFSYHQVRPSIFPNGRPDAQNAWFGHVGWGLAKNQLASYLICGFKMEQDFLSEIPQNFYKELFPNQDEDYILDYFLKMKNMNKYEGEAQRALNKIYLVK